MFYGAEASKGNIAAQSLSWYRLIPRIKFSSKAGNGFYISNVATTASLLHFVYMMANFRKFWTYENRG